MASVVGKACIIEEKLGRTLLLIGVPCLVCSIYPHLSQMVLDEAGIAFLLPCRVSKAYSTQSAASSMSSNAGVTVSAISA